MAGYPLADSVEFLSIFIIAIITIPIFSWVLAIIVIPIIGSVFLLQVGYLCVTWKMGFLQKPLMEHSAKVAVESINNISVVKSIGIGPSMETLYKKRLKELNR